MKKILKIFITLFVTGALFYQFRGIFISPAPCRNPIIYTLGTFDTQFGISKSYFLNALGEAEKIWEKPFGKDLFTYAPEDSSSDLLKINLIYDYRQQATSKLASLGIVVKDSRASYDTLKAKFTALKAEHEEERNDFNEQVQAFNLKQQTYEKEVNFWNKKGRAPENEYNRLQTALLALQNESEQLQNVERGLNEKADEINALVVVLNRLANSLNLSVEKYNTINVSRGESFEEGVYSSDGSNREIDIYEFSNRAKLVRVLAHELGHALGLEHISDPKAIMYELNQGSNETLTATDLTALKIKCDIK